jgi:hypothetical protein
MPMYRHLSTSPSTNSTVALALPSPSHPQAIHAEVIALSADLVNVKGVLNAGIDDLQAAGFTT